jgi:hypothetical protein
MLSGEAGLDSHDGDCMRQWALLVSVISLLLSAPAYGGEASEITAVKTELAGDTLFVSWKLTGAFTQDVVDRLKSGMELQFKFILRLNRFRDNFADKKVSEKTLIASVRYSNLTRSFFLVRILEGTVIENDVVEQEETMKQWLTVFDRVEVFNYRDLNVTGTYYVRLKAELMNKNFLLFFPYSRGTKWVNSDKFEFRVPGDDQADLRRSAP